MKVNISIQPFILRMSYQNHKIFRCFYGAIYIKFVLLTNRSDKYTFYYITLSIIKVRKHS